MIASIEIVTRGKGLYEITDRVEAVVREAGLSEGLCTLLIQHTSASLTIQENADPSARRDLESWLDRLVPEDDPIFTHRAEGPDDMPSHVKAALTSTTLSIPIMSGRLALGTWQGIFLWEHRRRGRRRSCAIHIGA
ncbi:MAG TPA: secondary thiamine-phosphate synthase enzyme YjbQ [Thermoanaerobaculia bacterium]|nr:secondary thiamine-phosphate synthase enzyme YjbQ [Thermoanaerobaculia bacterium]